MRIVHILSLGLIAWTHAGWAAFLRLAVGRGLGRVSDGRESMLAAPDPSFQPTVTVIIAAHQEEEVIAATIAGLLAQKWPREKLQLIVACDGSPDQTARAAREAGADLVLELERGGKHAAQAAAVAQANGEILAFSDANTTWHPTALAELVAAFADDKVGYACGRVLFDDPLSDPAADLDSPTATVPAVQAGGNQEGAYWRLEMALRRLESDWWSVTAGNGAIYALRCSLWSQLRVDFGHDLSLPHQVVRAGYLAIDRPTAQASEPMVPSISGESKRKRRMMNQAWRVILTGGPQGGIAGGILDPRGLPPRYLASIISHRWLRYASPLLHLIAYGAGIAVFFSRRRSLVQTLALAGHLAVPVAALLAERFPKRPFLLARYYVAMTTTIATGLQDRLAHGTPEGWDRAEGTR